MRVRATAVWAAILIVAIANGALRVGWIIPRAGERLGHIVSTVTLCIAILLVAWLSMAWIGAATRGDAVRVGMLWLVLTLAFEFLGGHYLFGTPWSQLVADYNVLGGRVWVLVLVTTAIAPIVTR
jgi:hypothetical protein